MLTRDLKSKQRDLDVSEGQFHLSSVKVKVNRVYQLTTSLTATGTRVPYGITQCYLPPGRGDIPALTPAEAGTRLSDPRGMQR